MVEAFDPARCPVCGGDNRCALAAACNDAARTSCSDCWCSRAVISEAALRRVPEEARGVACLCASCAGVQDVGRARD